MSSNERDLLLRARADAAQAKQELTELAAVEKEVGAAAEEASIVAENAAQRQAARLSELASAENLAANAVAEMADAAAIGGKTYATAIDTARSAVARLEIAIESVRATGGPIDPKIIAELALYDGAVAAAAATTEKAGKSIGSLKTEAQLARGNVGGLAQAFAGLGGPVGGALLGFLGVEAALKLLPDLLKRLEDGGTSLGNQIAKLTGGIVEETKEDEKLNAELSKQDQHFKSLADAHDLLLRAQIAMAAGLLAQTENTRLLNAEELAREALLHRTIIATGDLAKAMKDLGIVETQAAEDTNAKAETFLLRYQAHLLDSQTAADRFAKANKSFLQSVADDFVLAGAKIPPEFQKIIDKLHIIPTEYEEANKAIDKHKAKIVELSAELTKHGTKLTEDVGKIKEHAKSQAESADAEYQSVSRSIASQIAALNDQHAKGLIGERDYRDQYAAFQLDQVNARRAWEEAVSKINDAAADKATAAITKAKAESDAILAKINAEAGARAALELNKESARKADVAAHAAELARADEIIARSEAIHAKFQLTAKLARDMQKDVTTAWEDIALKIDGAVTSLGKFIGLLPELKPGGGASGGASSGAGPSGGEGSPF